MLTSSDEVSGYNTDWLRTVRGQTRCVLRPRDTQEVSFSLKKIETIFLLTSLSLGAPRLLIRYSKSPTCIYSGVLIIGTLWV